MSIGYLLGHDVSILSLTAIFGFKTVFLQFYNYQDGSFQIKSSVFPFSYGDFLFLRGHDLIGVYL